MKKLLIILIVIVGLAGCKKDEIVTISVDKTEIKANGEDKATFIVKSNDNIVDDALIYFANTNEVLEGYTFTTQEAGEYNFYAKRNDFKSENITIKAIEEDKGEEKEEEVHPIVLSASEQNLIADGEQKTIFTVIQNNVDVTSQSSFYKADDNSKLPSNEFATTTAGTYKFYAKMDTIVSNIVEVVFAEVEVTPAVLSASKTNIAADGEQKTIFTVRHDNVDVTTESEIYNAADDSKLSSEEFSTTTPGTYTFYAVYKDVKTNEVTVTAREVSVGKSIVFVEGVNKESGWYDVNKKGSGDVNNDMALCWAASASNMIQWWQDRYVAAGNNLPEGTYNGAGEIYELDIFEEIFWNPQKWNNDGAWPNVGVLWYLEGTNLNAGVSGAPQPLVEGGYFKSVWDDVLANTYNGYSNGITGEYNNYYIWGNGSGLATDEDKLRKFTDLVVEFIDRGPVGMSVYPGGNAALHTVTLWGYEIDNETGLLTRIWLTDDGDQKSDPKVQQLNEYTVNISEIQVFTSKFRLPHFTNTDGTVWYGQSWAATLYPVAGYGSK